MKLEILFSLYNIGMNRSYGFESECRLEQFFLDTHNAKKTIGKYDLFDYESDTILIELKTRRNYHNSYFDTMIGANKIEAVLTELLHKGKERVLFYFQFTDGLNYYKLQEGFIFRKDYFKGELYYFIPVELLKETENCRPCPVKFVRGV